jgi:hypothetical protein
MHKADLEAILNDIDGQLQALQLSHREVLRVGDLLENQPGCESRVIRVDTGFGPGVARVNFAQFSRYTAVPILIQYYLGKFGFAPRVFGLIDGSDLRALVGSHEKLTSLRSPWPDQPEAPPCSVLLMEAVEDGWNILQPDRSRGQPLHRQRWNGEDILGQVEAIQNAATQLGIVIVDPQFLISRDGQVKIIDLDHCFVVDREGRYWGYEGHYREPLASWLKLENIKNQFVDQMRAALQEHASVDLQVGI